MWVNYGIVWGMELLAVAIPQKRSPYHPQSYTAKGDTYNQTRSDLETGAEFPGRDRGAIIPYQRSTTCRCAGIEAAAISTNEIRAAPRCREPALTRHITRCASLPQRGYVSRKRRIRGASILGPNKGREVDANQVARITQSSWTEAWKCGDRIVRHKDQYKWPHIGRNIPLSLRCGLFGRPAFFCPK